MIASPADVSAERQVIRDVLHEWNSVHSEDKKVVLMPISWETHAQPVLGDRPQAIINKQVLADCDLLVAVFWTRLGSPTGTSASGTVEEIDEHVKAGKEAMIYFSQAPVRPDSVDDAQYKALVQFRTQCQSRGLIDSYLSLGEFRDRFSRQLAQLVIRAYSGGTDDEAPAFAARQKRRAEDPVVTALTAPARELLLEAVADKQGAVLRFRSMTGLGIQTNERQFVKGGDPRSEATWDAAFRQLLELELLRDIGHKGEIFNLTDKGYQTAERLRGSAGAS